LPHVVIEVPEHCWGRPPPPPGYKTKEARVL
jgi:hypothetical protein